MSERAFSDWSAFRARAKTMKWPPVKGRLYFLSLFPFFFFWATRASSAAPVGRLLSNKAAIFARAPMRERNCEHAWVWDLDEVSVEAEENARVRLASESAGACSVLVLSSFRLTLSRVPFNLAFTLWYHFSSAFVEFASAKRGKSRAWLR